MKFFPSKSIAYTGLLIVFLSSSKLYSSQEIRIISLAPHLTEMIYSAGAGELLVGVVAYSDYPEQAKNIPLVGSYNQLNIEQIIKLNPSLIIAWQSGNSLGDINRLKQLGFNIWQTEIKKLADIPKQIRQIGEKTHHAEIANKEALKLENILKTLKTLKTLKEKKPTLYKKTVFYQVWDKPLYTIGKDQFITQAIELCGATNIFAKLPILAPQVTLEAVIKYNPRVILLGGSKQKKTIWQQYWLQYPAISAVKHQQIIKIADSVYQRPSARFITAIPQLCKKLYNYSAHP